MSLFRRSVTVCSLSSGSAGNATYIGDGHAGVLIDCGISAKRLFESMKACGLEGAPIDAVLITHEHGDHVGGAAVLSRQLTKRGQPVPFYMTQGTYDGSHPNARPQGFEAIEAGKSFRIRHFEVEPIPVPHDTQDPVAYRVRVGSAHVGVITDLGKPTHLVASHMKACDALVLEFNHDEEMLLNGPYPISLKQRIRGSRGHLSNVQAQSLLTQGMGPGLRHLMLAHLSEENNSPLKALVAARDTLKDLGAADQVQLYVTQQRQHLPPIQIETSDW